MDRYRKALVAVLGALLQILAVLDGASQAGVLPDSWVSVVQVLVLVASTYGVYKVKNAPMPTPLTIRTSRDQGPRR
jgi:hypothetical protein